MITLEEWTGQVCAALGLEPAMLDRDAVLDLTRDVAHGVARPAAPLTAYLLGVAAGRSGSADISQLAATVRALIPPEGL